MSKSIDLRAIAQKNGNRLGVDEASRFSATSAKADPHLLTVPCKYGHLYPGGDQLGVAVDSVRVASRLKKMGFHVAQDDGANFVVDLDDLPAIAKVVRPRRRRRVMP